MKKSVLLTLNKPNLNGRTYPTDVVEDAIRRYKELGKPMLVEYPTSRICPEVGVLANTVGTVENIEVVGDELVGDINLLPHHNEFYSLACRPASIGTYKEGTQEIEKMEIVSFVLTNDPA